MGAGAESVKSSKSFNFGTDSFFALVWATERTKGRGAKGVKKSFSYKEIFSHWACVSQV